MKQRQSERKKRWGARKVDMAVHGCMGVGSEFVCFSFPCVLAFLPNLLVHPWHGSHRKEERKKTQKAQCTKTTRRGKGQRGGKK